MTPSKKSVILVTGGGGYIGSVLCDFLVQKGQNVRVFDSFLFGTQALDHLKGKLTVIKGDIRKPPPSLMKNVGGIVHLAAHSNDATAELYPPETNIINMVATVNLARMAKSAGVQRFIFASSCSLYDRGLEKENGVKDETFDVLPYRPYSISKYDAEQAILPLSDKKFCVVVFRKGTVYGFSHRMRFDLIVNTMVKSALTTGKIKVFCKGVQWRPLVAIEDVAQAYFAALKEPEASINGQIFNIANGNFRGIDVAHIVQKTLLDKFSTRVKIVFEENNRKDRSYRVTTAKAQKHLRFHPQTSIEESVCAMVEGIRNLRMHNLTHPRYYNMEWLARRETKK